MNENKKIVWLASYPKSGNTWFRVFLSNLLAKKNYPININELYATPIASNRALFDEATGLSSAELTQKEIDTLRPEVYLYAAQKSNGILYQKIHDAWLTAPSGVPMIPSNVTKCVIYFVRNPLDIAISFANHLVKPLDETATIMANSNYSLSCKSDGINIQLQQRLLSWSEHVHSWVDLSNLPLIVLRYEDMKTNTFDSFLKAVRFIGLEASNDEIQKAIEFSDIKEMQKQESEKGFFEKPIDSPVFFRKGIAGDWKNILSDDIVAKICNDNREMMIRFGYLDSCGNPL